jgi:hypothetical protein
MMGLLRILRRQPKNKRQRADIERLLDAQTKLIAILLNQLSNQLNEIENALNKADEIKHELNKADEPMPKSEDYDLTTAVVVKPKVKKSRPPKKVRITAKGFDKDMRAWFEKRNNKWLTKKQIQTMAGSPVRGIANSSFYRFVKMSNLEVDKSSRTAKFRLGGIPAPSKADYPLVVPVAPVMYGASLTTISQQLKGTGTPIAVHNTECNWYTRKKGEWLVDPSYPMLFTKINKMFKTYGGGRTSIIKRCVACSRAGRLPLNI